MSIYPLTDTRTPKLPNITHCANNYRISMWQHLIKDRQDTQTCILKTDSCLGCDINDKSQSCSISALVL